MNDESHESEDGATEGAPGPPALSDWEVEQLSKHLDRVLGTLLERGDQDTAAAVVGLIEGIEKLHAEGMRRLAELVALDSELLRRANRDPVISGLFDLYDLTVSAGDAAAGIDPGGVSPTGDVSIVPEAKLVQLGRRLDRDDGDAAGGDAATVGVFDLDELGDANVCGVSIGNVSALIIRGGGEVRAFRNVCPGSPLPLHVGEVEGDALVCPWHGCRFELESGRRIDADGPPLQPFPTSESGGQLRIAVP